MNKPLLLVTTSTPHSTRVFPQEVSGFATLATSSSAVAPVSASSAVFTEKLATDPQSEGHIFSPDEGCPSTLAGLPVMHITSQIVDDPSAAAAAKCVKSASIFPGNLSSSGTADRKPYHRFVPDFRRKCIKIAALIARLCHWCINSLVTFMSSMHQKLNKVSVAPSIHAVQSAPPAIGAPSISTLAPSVVAQFKCLGTLPGGLFSKVVQAQSRLFLANLDPHKLLNSATFTAKAISNDVSNTLPALPSPSQVLTSTDKAIAGFTVLTSGPSYGAMCVLIRAQFAINRSSQPRAIDINPSEAFKGVAEITLLSLSAEALSGSSPHLATCLRVAAAADVFLGVSSTSFSTIFRRLKEAFFFAKLEDQRRLRETLLALEAAQQLPNFGALNALMQSFKLGAAVTESELKALSNIVVSQMPLLELGAARKKQENNIKSLHALAAMTHGAAVFHLAQSVGFGTMSSASSASLVAGARFFFPNQVKATHDFILGKTAFILRSGGNLGLNEISWMQFTANAIQSVSGIALSESAAKVVGSTVMTIAVTALKPVSNAIGECKATYSELNKGQITKRQAINRKVHAVARAAVNLTLRLGVYVVVKSAVEPYSSPSVASAVAATSVNLLSGVTSKAYDTTCSGVNKTASIVSKTTSVASSFFKGAWNKTKSMILRKSTTSSTPATAASAASAALLATCDNLTLSTDSLSDAAVSGAAVSGSAKLDALAPAPAVISLIPAATSAEDSGSLAIAAKQTFSLRHRISGRLFANASI